MQVPVEKKWDNPCSRDRFREEGVATGTDPWPRGEYGS